MYLIYTVIVDKNDKNVSVVSQFAINLASEIRQRNVVTAFKRVCRKTRTMEPHPRIFSLYSR